MNFIEEVVQDIKIVNNIVIEEIIGNENLQEKVLMNYDNEVVIVKKDIQMRVVNIY